jgi:cell division protein FtsZ
MHYGAGEIESDQTAQETEHHTHAEQYIPPPAETAPTRIPRTEEFPPVAQRQLEARRTPRATADEDRGPLSLLRRLAGVGLGRREDDGTGGGEAAASQPPMVRNEPRLEPRPAVRPAAPAHAPQQRPAQPRPAAQQEALYRPAQGNLDPHGRAQPRDARLQDDDLEIPAFLRRQSN